ncbi:MAG: dihydroorotase [Candidatus Margulisiibacteriota bacterium]
MTLLIKKGKVVDPASRTEGIADILIEDGRIKSVAPGQRAKVKQSQIIDAEGLLVLPGLIDMHCHLRDPGDPEEETIASGSMAAAMGGFTSIACMANTTPPIDTPAMVKYIVGKAEAEGLVNVFPIGAVTEGLKGEALAEMGRMRDEGAVAFSDDGQPVMNSRIMRIALEYSKQFNMPIISHCEDLPLCGDGVMHEGYYSTILGLPGIPAASEEIMIERDIKLAREFGGRLHIAHVSTRRSVEIIRKAKREGVKVTCETCPHYFVLTDKDVLGYDTNMKVKPPLRSEADRKAIIRGLKDGTIDVIATDHAPHRREKKNVEFNLASFGMIGLETALPLVLTCLVGEEKMKLRDVVARLSYNPGRILGLKGKGSLKPGADADITIVDPKEKHIISKDKFVSKSSNSPFVGREVKGAVKYTIVKGRAVVKDGKLS